ncbi:MAG TPA: alcohol dehydrogenase catalytic domain-containing protein, partial [Myxococcales bacterium]|nr:alcohol dehydrogenase catalytic domain-containing protein [Myxococcales bacterium]
MALPLSSRAAMRAVVVESPGGPEVLQIAEVPDPQPRPGDLLVRVRAAGVNRADLLQRLGRYPPPKGESEILGLEIAGEVVRGGGAF